MLHLLGDSECPVLIRIVIKVGHANMVSCTLQLLSAGAQSVVSGRGAQGVESVAPVADHAREKADFTFGGIQLSDSP